MIFVCPHCFVYLQSLAQLVQIEEGGLGSRGGVTIVGSEGV